MKKSNQNTEKIAIFHKGKLTYRSSQIIEFLGIFNQVDLGYFGENIHFIFENYEKILNNVDSSINNQLDEWFSKIWDINDLSNEEITKINEILKDTEYDYESLGDAVVYIDSYPCHNGTTFEEYNSGNCIINIDHDYDTYICTPVSELDEYYINIILKENSVDTNKYLRLIDKLEFVEFLQKLSFDNHYIAETIYNDYTIEELIKYRDLELTDEHNEDAVKFEGEFYQKK